MSNFKAWIRVRGGSELEMKLEVPAGKIASGRVRCLAPDGRETSFDDNQLQTGHAKLRLAGTGTYSIRVRLTFSDACKVRFEARLNKPAQGGLHGTPFVYEPRGQAGSVNRATMSCTMA